MHAMVSKSKALAFTLIAVGQLPGACCAAEVTVHILVSIPGGHIDDCTNPKSNTCLDAPGVTTNGVRNGIPAGAAALILLKSPSPSGSKAYDKAFVVQNPVVAQLQLDAAAKEVLALSERLFARTFANAPPQPSYSPVEIRLTLPMPLPVSLPRATACGTDLCLSITLPTSKCSSGAAGCDIPTQWSFYDEAENALAAADALYATAYAIQLK